MKILSMAGQAQIFLLTMLIGFCIGFVFDSLRAFRRTVKRPNFFTQLEDILFWISVSVAMFYVMLNENHGEIRFYSILGAALGAVLYFETLSRLVLPFLSALGRLIIKTVGFIIMAALAHIIGFPLKFIKKASKATANRTSVVLRRLGNYGKIKTGKAFKRFPKMRRKEKGT